MNSSKQLVVWLSCSWALSIALILSMLVEPPASVKVALLSLAVLWFVGTLLMTTKSLVSIAALSKKLREVEDQ